MSWRDLKADDPALARFGAERLSGGVAYLATIRPDGGPRLHPVTPFLAEGRLFIFMETTSPKGKELERDGRFALHCAVEDADGGRGEFLVTGTSEAVDDVEMRLLAAEAAPYEPAERYVLFDLDVRAAFSTTCDEEGRPHRRRW